QHVGTRPWPSEDSCDAALESVDVGRRRHERRGSFADGHDPDLAMTLQLLDELRQPFAQRLKRRVHRLAVVDKQHDLQRCCAWAGAKNLTRCTIFTHLEISGAK